MACGFCATGQAGFTRQLTTGEIVEQVVRASRRARDGGRRVCNVVFMGMGEPLANDAAVWARGRAAARRPRAVGPAPHHLHRRHRARHPAAGRAPPAGEPGRSLHAANDALRDELVPINRRYPLDDADGGVRRLPRGQGPPADLRVGADRRRQRPAVRRRRAGRAVPPPAADAHVNLIPLNPTPGWPTKGTSRRPASPRSATSWRSSASTPPCAATGAPTSTPPAVSWRRPLPVTLSSRRPGRTDRG